MRRLPFLTLFFLIAIAASSLFVFSGKVLARNSDPNSTLFGSGTTYFNPSPESYGDELYGQAVGTGTTGTQSDTTGGINSTRWIKMVFSDTSLALAHDAIGLPNQPGSYQVSAARFLAGGIDTLTTTPPASSVQYIAYLGREFHIPGTPTVAYADTNTSGWGFTELGPVLKLWTAARNLAYGAFAFIFVIVGLMIMFRIKTDPKTAVTIQSALPKIIMALVLVTFSYAIAGLLIDLMYVSLGLIAAVVKSAANIDITADKGLLSGSIFNFVYTDNGSNGANLWSATQNSAASIGDIVDSIVTNSTQMNKALGNVAGGLANGLAYLIVAVAILIALFRTWLSLIGAYANIIIAIIGSPLMLMMDAIPGQNQFNNWVRNMLSNLLAFPVVVAMLAIGSAIVNTGASSSSNGFVPPLLGAGNFQSAINLVGLGILLSIPRAVQIVQDLMKTPPFKYGNAWQESLSAGANVSRVGAQYAIQSAPAREVVNRTVGHPVENIQARREFAEARKS